MIKAVYIEGRELKCDCVGGGSNVPLGFISLTENLAIGHPVPDGDGCVRLRKVAYPEMRSTHVGGGRLSKSHADVSGSADGLVGSLEYEVLQALWNQSPLNVGAVLQQVNAARRGDDELAYTTVMTVLSRLFDKQVLDRVQVGRAYDYTPRFDEGQLVVHLGRGEVADLVERYGDVALAQFASVLNSADADTLQRLEEVSVDTTDA